MANIHELFSLVFSDKTEFTVSEHLQLARAGIEFGNMELAHQHARAVLKAQPSLEERQEANTIKEDNDTLYPSIDDVLKTTEEGKFLPHYLQTHAFKILALADNIKQLHEMAQRLPTAMQILKRQSALLRALLDNDYSQPLAILQEYALLYELRSKISPRFEYWLWQKQELFNVFLQGCAVDISDFSDTNIKMLALFKQLFMRNNYLRVNALNNLQRVYNSNIGLANFLVQKNEDIPYEHYYNSNSIDILKLIFSKNLAKDIVKKFFFKNRLARKIIVEHPQYSNLMAMYPFKSNDLIVLYREKGAGYHLGAKSCDLIGKILKMGLRDEELLEEYRINPLAKELIEQDEALLNRLLSMTYLEQERLVLTEKEILELFEKNMIACRLITDNPAIFKRYGKTYDAGELLKILIKKPEQNYGLIFSNLALGEIVNNYLLKLSQQQTTVSYNKLTGDLAEQKAKFNKFLSLCHDYCLANPQQNLFLQSQAQQARSLEDEFEELGIGELSLYKKVLDQYNKAGTVLTSMPAVDIEENYTPPSPGRIKRRDTGETRLKSRGFRVRNEEPSWSDEDSSWVEVFCKESAPISEDSSYDHVQLLLEAESVIEEYEPAKQISVEEDDLFGSATSEEKEILANAMRDSGECDFSDEDGNFEFYFSGEEGSAEELEEPSSGSRLTGSSY